MTRRAVELEEISHFMGTIDRCTIDNWCTALIRSGRFDAVKLASDLEHKLKSADPNRTDEALFDTLLYEDEVVALKIGIHRLLGALDHPNQDDMRKLHQLVSPLPR